MTDLRQAAEQALRQLQKDDVYLGHRSKTRADAIEALRQALAQPEQEPLGGEWVPCVKLPVIVHVRNQRDGENHISTREGITPVLPEDLIMRGVAGEEYPIGRELFERTYTFDTAPPKREWVGLTDDDIHDAFNYVEMVKLLDFDRDRPEWCEAFARACEARLRHRNGEKQ